MLNRNIINSFLTLLILLFVGGHQVSAVDTDESTERSIPYSVTPIIPNSQIGDVSSYYDIRLAPRDEEILKLLISNTSSNDIVIHIAPNVAKTSTSGTIDYSGGNTPLSDTMPIDFSEIISEEQEITLPKNSSKEVPFKIKMPNKNFDGALLGGFYVTQVKEEDTKKKNDKTGVSITNDYAFIIGIKITQNDKEIEPKFSLNTIKVNKWNERYSLNISIVNEASKIMSDMTLESSIYQKDKLIKKLDNQNFSMAPDSIFDNNVFISPSELPKGNYTYKAIIKKDNQTYKVEKDFIVTSEDVKKATDNVINDDQTKQPVLIYLIIFGVVLLIIIIILFFLTKNKQKKKKSKIKKRKHMNHKDSTSKK